MEVDKDKAVEVWRLLVDDKSPYRIDQMDIASQRSAERLQTVRMRRERGESATEIAAALTGWTPKRVHRVVAWYDDWRTSQAGRRAPAADPGTTLAEAKHFEALAGAAQLLLDDLLDMDRYVHPIHYGGVAGEPELTFRGEAWTTGGVALFGQLKQHLAGDERWVAFDTLKHDLSEQVNNILEHPDGEHFYPGGTSGSVHGVIIAVRHGYALPGGGGGSVRLDTPASQEEVVHELQRVVVNGSVAGHCDLCPD